MRPSFAIAQALYNDVDKYTVSDFDALGVTDRDFEITTGQTPWNRAQIPTVMRTIQALCYGTCEVLGTTKIELPTEYVAMIIATFVNPANYRTACAWMEQEQRQHFAASDLADTDSVHELKPTSARKCFALICMLKEQGSNTAARERWEAAMGLAIERANEGV